MSKFGRGTFKNTTNFANNFRDFRNNESNLHCQSEFSHIIEKNINQTFNQNNTNDDKLYKNQNLFDINTKCYVNDERKSESKENHKYKSFSNYNSINYDSANDLQKLTAYDKDDYKPYCHKVKNDLVIENNKKCNQVCTNLNCGYQNFNQEINQKNHRNFAVKNNFKNIIKKDSLKNRNKSYNSYNNKELDLTFSFNSFDNKKPKSFAENTELDNIKQFDQVDYTNKTKSHIPKIREIDDIFAEDDMVANSYSHIRANDDDLIIKEFKKLPVNIVEEWKDANLHEQLMSNICKSNYIFPRKIQSYAIPAILNGLNVKGQAETGSGKTAAFLIPIIHTIICKKETEELKSKRSRPFALIIEPTRELVLQVYDQARKLTNNLNISVAKAYGKYIYRHNLNEISSGCDILIGTPGRLCDVITNEFVLMENLKYLVFDEVDQLLKEKSVRFLRQITEVKNFPEKEKLQTLMFSATFTSCVQEWAEEWLGSNSVLISNYKSTSANNKVTQKLIMVEKDFDKKENLLHMLKKELQEKQNLTNKNAVLRRTLVFVKTKRDADLIALFLCQDGINAITINGDRSQEQREEALEKFRKNIYQVVVSTDVCARGLDIKDLDHVINLDLPEDYVTYVHRIGRTGRLKNGLATSYFDPQVDANLADSLIKGIYETNQEVPQFLLRFSKNQSNFNDKYVNNFNKIKSTTKSFDKIKTFNENLSINNDNQW